MKNATDWTTAADIDAELLKRWTRGHILAASLGGEPVFPLRLRVRGPDSAALAERFDDARTWIRTLEAASRTGRGFGFDILWREVRHPQLGRNRIPSEILVSDPSDGLRLIRKQADARRFDALAATTSSTFPGLLPWLARKPLVALDHADDWPRILAVLAWFRDHPASGLYLRQVDIPLIDTKFIETRRGLLTELLDIVLGRTPRIELPAPANFEARYGLRGKPPTVRFRLLDTSSAFGGLTDISTPADAFARLDLAPRIVFITENEINGLAFPPVRDAIVLFGLGYSLDLLAGATWLQRARLLYWGDIDTHGFAMLSRIRTYFPAVESLLMDEGTLLAHEPLWVCEDRPFLGEAPHLTETEQSLFVDLKNGRFGHRVRLEQERIAYRRLLTSLRALGLRDFDVGGNG